MWCNNCHNGGPNYNPPVRKGISEPENAEFSIAFCNQCGKEAILLEDNPFPDLPQKKGSGKPNGKTNRKRQKRKA